MNKKTIAIGVAKHPLIKKILEAKLAESSLVSRLIIEETEGFGTTTEEERIFMVRNSLQPIPVEFSDENPS
jgi:hypothetical protein